MIWESFLAVLVIMAIAGGLGMGLDNGTQILIGPAAYQHQYSSWLAASGLKSKLQAFITGSANLWATFDNITRFYSNSDMLLVGFSIIILGLTAWLFTSGISAFIRYKR